jgi:transposase
MLSIASIQRCYLYCGPTDMRKGVDGLCGLVRNELGKDPLSGELYVFLNRTRSQVKLLLWDLDGFALYAKRLEKGTYDLPAESAQHAPITAQQLNFILAGVSLKTVKLRPRYRHNEHERPVAKNNTSI